MTRKRGCGFQPQLKGDKTAARSRSHAIANRRRKGLSLVEMLVIMTVGAAVMGGVVVGATSLLRANSRILAADDGSRLLHQLADSLRQDLHAAQRVEWDADAARLTLTMPDDTSIEYHMADARCDRTAGEAAKPWRLPDGVAMTCTPATAAAPALFEVSIHSEPDAWPVRVVAGLGRDQLRVSEEEAPE